MKNNKRINIKNIGRTIDEFCTKYFVLILLFIFGLKSTYQLGITEGKRMVKKSHIEDVRTVSLLSCVRGQLNKVEASTGWDLGKIGCKELSESWNKADIKKLKENL